MIPDAETVSVEIVGRQRRPRRKVPLVYVLALVTVASLTVAIVGQFRIAKLSREQARLSLLATEVHDLCYRFTAMNIAMKVTPASERDTTPCAMMEAAQEKAQP